MCGTRILASVALATLSVAATAAHIDIVPYYDNGELAVGSHDLGGDQPIQRNVLVFTGTAVNYRSGPGFVSTIDPGWTKPYDEPGIYPDGTAPIPLLTFTPTFRLLDHSFNYLSIPSLGANLAYWDGLGTPSFGAAPAGETLDIYLPPAPGQGANVVTLDGSNTGGEGFMVAQASEQFHVHSVSELWGSLAHDSADDPAEGFYLYSLNLEVADEVSDPFFILLAHGFEKYAYDGNGVEMLAPQMQAAVDWVHANLGPTPVPLPAGVWLLLSGLVGFMTLNRKHKHGANDGESRALPCPA